MAISKLILNGEVQMDVTSDTVEANKLLSGETATKNDGTKVTGTFVAPDPVISSLSVTPTESEQVFSGAETNILESFKMSSYDTTNRTITADVDFSYLEYGATYHVEGKINYYPGSGQVNRTVTIDTDWVASENGEIPFTNDNGGSVSKVTLSKTQIIVYFSVSISSRWSISYNNSDRRAFVFTRSVDGYKPVTVGGISSTYIGSAVPLRSNADMYKSEYAVYAPSGYYSSEVFYTVPVDEHTAPTINFDSNYGTIRAIHNATDTIRDKHILSGASYMFSDRQLPSLGAQTITPTESTQYISSYQWLTGSQTIEAIPSTYVGSAIPLKSSADLTTNGSTVFVSSGYYSSDARTNVAAVTSLPSVSFSFTSVTDEEYATYTMSYSFTTSGFVSTGTHSEITGSWPYYKARTITPNPHHGYVVIGNAVSIAAFEEGAGGITVKAIPSSYIIPSGTYSVTENGMYDISNYAYVDVSVAGSGGDENAFIMRSFSSTVYENSTLTTIGPGAFAYATMLSGVSIPNVTTIGSFAFYGCSLNLSRNDIYNFNNVVSINDYAFFNAFGTNITTLNSGKFPKAEYIGAYAFADNPISFMLSFPNVSYVGEGAFYDTALYTLELLSSSNFPKLKYIGNYAFTGAVSITKVSLPLVEYIGEQAFCSLSNYGTRYTGGARPRASAAWISTNTKLRSAIFPNCSIIGSGAFNKCTQLSYIEFPLCTDIYQSAFSFCYSLTTVDFPECINIGSNAFYSCQNLTTASFQKCKSIGGYAFFSCSALSDVSFPSATFIGTSAFVSCWHLTMANFPECSLISYNAFRSCSALTSAYFPKCTTIMSSAFYSCSSLSDISFPLVETIHSEAFRSCAKLSEAYFPKCSTIERSAFLGCRSLTVASFPECSAIYTNAFNGITSLTSAYFPSCKIVGSYAFNGCTILSDISFPAAQYVYDYAFSSCAMPTKLTLSECKLISTGAMSNCSQLMEISLPNCVSIGSGAFNRCGKLGWVYLFGSSVTNLVSTNAFYLSPIASSDTALGRYGSIYVPASLYDSYISAENWSYYSLRIVSLTDEQITAL